MDEIDQLKNKDREIAKYYFIYEYNISEISKKLNIPRKTVEYRKNKKEDSIIYNNHGYFINSYILWR